MSVLYLLNKASFDFMFLSVHILNTTTYCENIASKLWDCLGSHHTNVVELVVVDQLLNLHMICQPYKPELVVNILSSSFNSPHPDERLEAIRRYLLLNPDFSIDWSKPHDILSIQFNYNHYLVVYCLLRLSLVRTSVISYVRPSVQHHAPDWVSGCEQISIGKNWKCKHRRYFARWVRFWYQFHLKRCVIWLSKNLFLQSSFHSKLSFIAASPKVVAGEVVGFAVLLVLWHAQNYCNLHVTQIINPIK